MFRYSSRILLAAALTGCSLFAQQSKQLEEASTQGFLLNPQNQQFDQSLLSRLRVPAGFRVSIFAQNLVNPRFMAVNPSTGDVYVTRRQLGDVVRVRDLNNDGRADQQERTISGIRQLNGITYREGKLYLVGVKDMYVSDVDASGALGSPRQIVNDLPDGGQHPNRTLAFGPDGLLYVQAGSTCNACPDTNPENATILRMQPDGTGRTVFAEGLRNTIGFDWHPTTRELWGMDMGSDWRGNDTPPDELNRIVENNDYGWPFCWADRQVDRHISQAPEGGISRETYCSRTQPSVLSYQAHSSPLGLVFYNSTQFPSTFRGDAFVTFRGSWNRNPPSGYKVVRVRFQNGQPNAFEDFLTGWLAEDGRSYFGRPAGIVVDRDGSLLVADDTNGVIYRISYVGQ